MSIIQVTGGSIFLSIGSELLRKRELMILSLRHIHIIVVREVLLFIETSNDETNEEKRLLHYRVSSNGIKLTSMCTFSFVATDSLLCRRAILTRSCAGPNTNFDLINHSIGHTKCILVCYSL